MRPLAPGRWANRLQRLSSLYCRLGLLVYACLLAKNLLVIALELPSAAHLRWLDCYLLGRVQMASRIPKTSKFCVIVVDIMMLIGRLFFIAYAKEIRLFGGLVLRNIRAHAGIPAEERAGERHFLLDSCLANPLSPSDEPICRPNRAAERPRWELLALSLAYLAALCIWLGYLTGIALITSPMFVTKRGFELLYPNCVGWHLQRATTNNNSDIYQLDPSRSTADIFGAEIPFQLPLVDLVPVNLYHIVRIAVEFSEQFLAHTDILIFYTIHLNIIYALSLDLIVYVQHLRSWINTMTAQLALLPLASDAYKSSGSPIDKESALEPQLVALQGHLLDYFHLVRAYNPYVGAVSLLHLCPWLFYAFMIFVRYLQSDKLKVQLDAGADLELPFLFFATLLPILIGMVAEFLFASHARRLFAQIVRLMALDDGSSQTKTRWITLINFYFPKSLYCFTILNTIELTWLYGLKLFAWVISALFVLRSL